MEFKKLAETLGITTYPEKFETIYANLTDEKTNFCDIAQITACNDEFGMLGAYTELVLEGAKAVLADEVLYKYGRTICDYIKVSTVFESRHVPLPVLDGSIGRDVFGTLLIMTLIPESVKFHRAHGFTEEEIKEQFAGIAGCMKRVEDRIGRPAMSMSYYNWTLIKIFGELFHHDGYEYQFRPFYGGAILLKNKETGEFLPMMIENTFHRNGRILGCPGATEEEGSYGADFTETEDAFIGRPVIKGRVSSEISEYKKNLWECVLRPDDEVLAVHIPRGTDMSHEAFIRSFRGSFQVAKERYPERDPKFLVCFSWLMDPALAELMPKSKIAAFGNAFLKYPLESSGKEVRSWVFPNGGDDNKLLPEDTSLQRMLKTLFLAGGYIYYTAGICTEVLRPEE